MQFPAAVDARWRLYVDPDKIDQFDDEQLVFVMQHEVAHLLLRHHIRARRILRNASERRKMTEPVEFRVTN